jgi:outer membrane murein-binding lipoprotein Lpp
MTYSSSLALGRQRTTGRIGRNQNAVSFRRSERTLGPISNTVILIVLAAILGFLYLSQVTKTNAIGYKISSLQTQQTQLTNQHQDLEIASASMQSLQRVQDSSVAKNLTPVTPSGVVR